MLIAHMAKAVINTEIRMSLKYGHTLVWKYLLKKTAVSQGISTTTSAIIEDRSTPDRPIHFTIRIFATRLTTTEMYGISQVSRHIPAASLNKKQILRVLFMK